MLLKSHYLGLMRNYKENKFFETFLSLNIGIFNEQIEVSICINNIMNEATLKNILVCPNPTKHFDSEHVSR